MSSDPELLVGQHLGLSRYHPSKAEIRGALLILLLGRQRPSTSEEAKGKPCHPDMQRGLGGLKNPARQVSENHRRAGGKTPDTGPVSSTPPIFTLVQGRKALKTLSTAGMKSEF